MESTNILMGGVDELRAIKQKVIELNNYTEQKKTLETLENQLEKSIEKKENEISDEVAKATRQRREQMEATFDEQIYSVNEKLKKVQSKKEKTKRSEMSHRIDKQTADYKNEEEELNLDGKSIFKQENIPLIYNNRLIFALYFPRGIVDYVIILLLIIIVFFVIPLGVYYTLLEGMNIMYLALCYIAVILIFGGIYLIIGKNFKHKDALDRVRGMRRKIKESKRQQRRIKQNIRSDKDESSYSLDEFDKEIKNLQISISDLMEQKKKALSDFDHTTSQDVKNQIKSSHEDELSSLKAKYNEIYEQNKNMSDQLNKLTLSISVEYEGYLGKDILSVEKIEQLEEIMTAGNAKTISEAVDVLSQK